MAVQMSEKQPLLDQDAKVSPEEPTPTPTTSAHDNFSIVSPQQFQSYHRLLASFFKFKRSVSNTRGLFRAEHSKFLAGLDQEQQHRKVQEKRWSVYLARAVHRFEVWWQTCVPNSSPGSWPFGTGIARETEKSWSDMDTAMEWKEEDMLPLDVFMVLHAWMLHSRAFLEDCIRHHKMSIWNSSLPLDLIDRCIDSRTFAYCPPEAAKQNFERKTGLSWDNTHDPETIEVECFRCGQAVQVPWTTRRETGYAEASFLQICPSCNYSIDRFTIPVLNFRKDLLLLRDRNVSMRGTYLGVTGRDTYARTVFPNLFFKDCLASGLLEETSSSRVFPRMGNLLEIVADAVRDQDVVRRTRAITKINSITNVEISALHHVLSRYDHAGSFSDDLHSATLQFSGFLESMKAQVFRWVKCSATLPWILGNNPGFYKDFLVQKHKGKASSTGDSEMDTAFIFLWHAHRTMPRWYYQFSVALTKGAIIDDDDGYSKSHNAAECPLCNVMLPSFHPLRWLDRFLNFVDRL